MQITIIHHCSGGLAVTAAQGLASVTLRVRNHDEAADKMRMLFAALAALSEPTPEPNGGAK